MPAPLCATIPLCDCSLHRACPGWQLLPERRIVPERRNPPRGLARLAAEDAAEEAMAHTIADAADARTDEGVAALSLLDMCSNAAWRPHLTVHDALVAQDALLLFELTYREWRQRLRSSSPPRYTYYSSSSVFTTYTNFLRAALNVGDKELHWDCAPHTPFTGNLLQEAGSPLRRVSLRVEALLRGMASDREKKLKHFVSASAAHMPRAVSQDLSHCLPCADCARRRQVHWDGLLLRRSACPQTEHRACELSRSAG